MIDLNDLRSYSATAIMGGIFKMAYTTYNTKYLRGKINKNSYRIRQLDLAVDILDAQQKTVFSQLSDIEKKVANAISFSIALQRINVDAELLSQRAILALQDLKSIILHAVEHEASAQLISHTMLANIAASVIKRTRSIIDTDYKRMRTDITNVTAQRITIRTHVAGYEAEPHDVYKIYPIPIIQHKTIPKIPDQWIAVNQDNTQYLPIAMSAYQECQKSGCVRHTSRIASEFAECGAAQFFGKDSELTLCEWLDYDELLFTEKTQSGFLFATGPKGIYGKISCRNEPEDINIKLNRSGHVTLQPGCQAAIYGKVRTIRIAGPTPETSLKVDKYKIIYLANPGENIGKHSVFSIQLAKHNKENEKSLTMTFWLSVVAFSIVKILLLLVCILSQKGILIWRFYNQFSRQIINLLQAHEQSATYASASSDYDKVFKPEAPKHECEHARQQELKSEPPVVAPRRTGQNQPHISPTPADGPYKQVII